MSDDLAEVDQDSPPTDHLGDYVELSDPYPATRASYSDALIMVPDSAHANPDEIRQDFGVFASAPHKQGTQVRPVTPSSWFPFGVILADGVQSQWLVEEDPYRTRTTIFNHATGGIWLAPTPSRSPGAGALYVPGRDPTTGYVHHRELNSWARVYLFTLTGFIAGLEPIHVQAVTERWG